MTVVDTLTKRYTAKAYDKSRTIPSDIVTQLLAALRYSPSSVNSQPWHLFISDTDAGKARIAIATSGVFAFNVSRLLNASHLVVLSACGNQKPDYLSYLLTTSHGHSPFAR